jgi:hypothetical protein
LIGGIDGTGSEQQTERRFVELDDVDDDLGRSNRVAWPGGDGGLPEPVHGSDGLVRVLADFESRLGGSRGDASGNVQSTSQENALR